MSIKRTGRLQAAIKRLEAATDASRLSRQPRLTGDRQAGFFYSVYDWVKRANLEAPPYSADSRRRDAWLAEFWRRESHLAGVVNSVVAIDKNRAWQVTGGRNQVARYTSILRNAEDGAGWRYWMSQQSLSYYTSDLGALTELGREGAEGPVRALYTLDPTRCRLTGDWAAPLAYDGTKEPWRAGDYFRVTSMPATREEFNGLGYCALSRCIELAATMIAVYEHDQEMLGARSPKGLLLLKGISMEQWTQAMQARSAELSARQQEWFGAVAVLGSEGAEDIDAKLFALSQLPAGFNIEVTTKLLMYAYALAFGYDPIEFWPVEAGSLGRGRETEIQHQKATGKGGADFMLGMQDQLQLHLPKTVQFEFEQRDASGMVLEAEVIKAWVDVANALYDQGMGILSREQAASFLVANGIIPAEWTEMEEESVATDAEMGVQAPEPDEAMTVDDADATEAERARLRGLRARALEAEPVRRAAIAYPDEPIVRYEWPTGRTTLLWARGADAVPRRRWHLLGDVEVTRRRVPRRREDEGAILYEQGEVTITEADVQTAIADGRRRVGAAFGEVLEGRPLTDEEMDALDRQHTEGGDA